MSRYRYRALGAAIFFISCGALAVGLRWISDRAQLRKFVVSFQKLQGLLALRPRYRVATDSDVELFAWIPETHTIEVRRHMTLLGDVVVVLGDAHEGRRLFVDETRTTLFIVRIEGATAESYTDTLEMRTSAERQTYSARPPFVMQQLLSKPVSSIPQIIAAHRHFVKSAAQEPLRRFETLADALATLNEMSDRHSAWRSAQDPVQLMQDDLRMLVGPKAQVLWARCGSRLRADIPRAEMRSRPRPT